MPPWVATRPPAAPSQLALTSAHTGKLTVDLGVLETENVSAKKFTGVDAIKIGTDDTGGVQNQLIDVASGTEVIVDSVEAVDNTRLLTPTAPQLLILLPLLSITVQLVQSLI